jgi:hypothetical protein
MKLSTQQVASVRHELGADPLREDNPAMDSLRGAFGDHTFYVGSDGLFVFEPVNDPDAGRTPAQLVLVAAWADAQKSALEKVPPQETDRVVDLAAADDGVDGSAA